MSIYGIYEFILKKENNHTYRHNKKQYTWLFNYKLLRD